MTSERDNTPSTNRRRFLTGLGATGVASLAGCVNPLYGDDGSNAPESINQIRLESLPESASITSDRIAVPSLDLVDSFNLRHLQQIRINRNGTAPAGDFVSALYTVNTELDFPTEDTEKTIWLSESALDRVNASPGWMASVNGAAPNPSLDSNAQENNEYIEQVIQANRNLICCAPHGGNIYPYTGEQAFRVASEISESAWVCLGYNEGGGAYDRWHINQKLLHPASFPKLAELISYDGDDDEDINQEYDRTYDNALYFGGTSDRGIYIGGLVPDSLKNELRDAIVEELVSSGGGNIPVQIVRTGDRAGTSTSALANRLSDDGHNGIQIIQGEHVRDNYWAEIADAVITVFGDD